MQIGSSPQHFFATPHRPRRRLRVCLLNPAQTAISSRIPNGDPPLALLTIGGQLLDDGFAVRMVDAARRGLSTREAIVAVLAQPVDVVMMEHPGSPSALPNLALRLKRLHPRLVIVSGGVHPAGHRHELLRQCQAIDFVVRGEGSACELLRLLDAGADWRQLPGVAWREAGGPVASIKVAMPDHRRPARELTPHAD